jgi:hypothetical protein
MGRVKEAAAAAASVDVLKGPKDEQQPSPIDAIAARSDKNLALWRQNETTDPAHTKPVRIGKDMTAIDTYYQIKRATETFGPIGVGWGWNLEEAVVEGTGKTGAGVAVAKCKVTVWYVPPDRALSPDGDIEKRCYLGPVIACNKLIDDKGYVDDEAFKKATSDGITKSLSYLGFSADIFMGLYDDTKYVARLKTEFGAKAETAKARLPEILTKAVEKLPEVKDLAELDIVWKTLKADLRKLPPAQLDYMKTRFAMRKRQLAPEDPAPGEQQGDENPPPDDGGEPRGDLHTGGPTTQP